MRSERTQLKEVLRYEYKNLDFYTQRAINFKKQKDFASFLIVNWIVVDIKTKINQYKLEIEILGEKGRLG